MSDVCLSSSRAILAPYSGTLHLENVEQSNCSSACHLWLLPGDVSN